MQPKTFFPPRDSRRNSLCRSFLAGVSTAVLTLLASPQGAHARSLGSVGGSLAAPTIASNAAAAAAQQAAAIAKQSQGALLRATQAIQAMQAAQNAARNLASTGPQLPNVPDGLSAGGLVVDPRVPKDLSNPQPGEDPTLWQNAKLPTQTAGNGQTIVTINQTAPQALLNWTTFNVGRNTLVDFDQHGNASWVALNKINDPSGVPSQILGQIKADGQVYLINRNGIIFGGSSQVNVGTLVASALPINDALVNAGTLYSNLDAQFTFSAYSQPGGPTGPTASFNNLDAATTATQDSKVIVQPGAIIQTPLSLTNSGGRVILIGPEVANNGTILTPDGQTILAAGQQVALLPHISHGPTDPQASLRGLDVYVGSVLAPVIGIAAPDLTNPSQVSGVATGTATNNGLIEADRGNISIFGATVNQMGTLLSTTSASLNGRIDLSASYNAQKPTGVRTTPLVFGAAGIVTLGAGSVTQILPELDSTDTVVGTTLALSSQLNVTGLAVYIGQNTQVYAPSAQVAIGAGTWNSASQNFGGNVGQIYIDSGASIDVSGSVNVAVPVTENIVAAQLFAAQLADSPLQRNGPLHGKTVFVDLRRSGTNADGSTWIGTPLADASGYVNLIQRTVGELTIGGGSIALTAGQSVVLQQGSTLNVSGGFINYQGGMVKTSVLVGSDGRRYSMANANPNISYIGIAGGFTVDHAHWGIKEIFGGGDGHFEQGYIQGGGGGSITVQAPGQTIDGQLLGLTVAGPYQRQILPSSPILSYAGTDITALVRGQYQPAASSFNVTASGNIVLQAGGSSQSAAAFTPGVHGLDPNASVALPSELGSVAGFGTLKVVANNGNITVASDITGQVGGSITLTANNIDVEANVTAAGGTINLGAGPGSITLGKSASLNVAGLVVDDTPQSPTANTLPLAINGGSVSVAGFSLNLKSGSIIDASGGIAINAAGKASNGNGGSIALANGFIPPANPGGVVTFGNFVLGSTLKGYGVGTSGKGGSLSLQTAGTQIGGATTDPNTLLLAPDFFNQGGFANFVFAGVNGVTVAANTTIQPVVQSYQPASTSGSSASTLVPTTLPAVLRSPVALSLLAPGIQDLARGRVVVAAGASIVLGPTRRGTGSVSIGGLISNGKIASANGNTAAVLGSIIVPGGSIKFATGSLNPGEITTDLTPGSLLSTAGAVVPTIDAFGKPLGMVLAGGNITLSGNTRGEAGAVIDVSGASALINLPPDGSATGNQLHGGPVATRIDSDGGSLTLAASDTLLMAATLHGDAGGPTALGGSLSISSSSLIVSQHQIAPGRGPANLPLIFGAVSSFAVDSFDRGHFDSLTLGGNIAFFGPVNITAARSLTVATGANLFADSAVNLTAPYIVLGSAFAAPPTLLTPPLLPTDTTLQPTFGAGRLSVNAGDLLDVGGLTLYNIGATSLTARNDIRGDGTLLAAGNVTLTAGQIYPVTATVFTIATLDTTGHPGSVVIAGTGITPQLPLSAGGELNIFSTTIVQDGVLRAPLGTINLGSDATLRNAGTIFGAGTSFNATTTVTLGDGSITSVSAIDPATGQGLSLPYGLAPNGTSWTFPSGNDTTHGGTLPGKAINVVGATVTTASGSTLDLRGGGDLFAYNFVKGLGGSKDILATSTSFAIIPGYQADFAPLTQIFSAPNVAEPGWSNSNLSVGDQITLAASTNGLAAGTYTLLPARYALLPGAFLVTPKNIAASAPSIAQPDGSSIVSGARFNGLNTSRQLALQPSLFQVESAAQVKARAEYDIFSANAFFAQQAAASGTAPPRLPIDAGVLALNATASMILNGAVTMTAPQGGLGGIASISSTSNIQINDTGSGQAGTLYLSAPQLSNFGADTLVIGGTVTTGASGATLTAATGSIEVKNDSAGVLSGPDIVLISSGSLTVKPNADIEQRGSLAGAAQRFLIGSSATSGSGNGSLLRVSSDPSATIVRAGVTAGGAPQMTIGANARIKGNGVILDTTGSTTLDATTVVTGQAVSLGSGRISLQLNNPGALQSSPGLILPQAVLDGLQSTIGALSLLSYSWIDIYGTGAIGGIDATGRPTIASLALHAGGIRGFNNGGNTVTFNANNVTIDNSPNAAAAAAVAGIDSTIGKLVFNANTVTIGTNAFNVVGYGEVDLDAPNGVLVQGTGGLATAGDLMVTTGLITGATGANQTISAGGALTVNPPSGNPLVALGGLGATLNLVGASITENSLVVLQSGSLTLHATSGNVTVGGLLAVNGTFQNFFDQVKYTNGGQINLISDFGSVILNDGSAVSVAAQVAAGSAGTLSVTASNGTIIIDGALLLGGASSALDPTSGLPLYQAGTFNLDVGSLPSSVGGHVGALNAILDAAGFTQARSMRIRNGNVVVDGSASAHNFTLSADSGSITVTGSIDASGITGGAINLYAYNGVTLAGGSHLTVAAQQFDAAGKGGLVDIETGEAKLIGGNFVSGSGWIDIQAGSIIDLSVAGGPGGMLHLRAPQITGSGAPIPTLVNSVAGGNDVAIKPLAGNIVNPSSIIVEGFQVFDLTGGGGSITTTVESNVNANGQNFAGNTSAIISRLFNGTINSALSGLAHVRPGEELVTRSGDMTLPAGNDWNFNTYRYGPNVDPNNFVSGEPGILTLRAAGNLILLSSLTDGFMPTSVVPTYDYPYDPTTQRWLDVLLPPGAQSWSYRLVAGADLTAVDFHRVVPASGGSVRLGVPGNGNALPVDSDNLLTAQLLQTYYQVIRTGTGDIDIAAANDVQLLNPFASIYTAGTRVTPVAPSTLNSGGSVSLAANVPIVFPNSPGSDTVTASVDGTITYRPPVQDYTPSTGGLFNVPALPAGTVFTFPSGFNLPANLPGGSTIPLVSTAQQVQLVNPSNALLGLNPGATIGGIAAGVPISLSGVTVTPSSDYTFNGQHFTHGTSLQTIGLGTLVLDSPGTLTFDNPSQFFTLPAGNYTLTAGHSGPSQQFYYYLPPGTTLTPLDSAGGGLVLNAFNYLGVSSYLPTVSVVATIPLYAGTPRQLLPGSNSIALSGSGTLTLNGGGSENYTTASANGTSYAFDTPVPGGASFPKGSNGSTVFYPGIYYPAQYSTGGGNVRIAAGHDITHMIAGGITDGANVASFELPNNWLYRRGSVVNGQFAPGYDGDTQSTTWWVDFSNFTEGVGALGGGNVSLAAGRDVKNVDAVVPTNAWMPYSTTTSKPGGAITIDALAANQPLFEYGGGNLSVTAGRDISGGVYYVEKGNGVLTAGGAVTTNFARQAANPGSLTALNEFLPTTLFLGKGSFTVNAGGDVLLGQVANAFMLPQGILNGTWERSYFSTYAATDTVAVSSLSGTVTLRGETSGATSTTPFATTLNSWFQYYGNDPRHWWLQLVDRPDTETGAPAPLGFAADLGANGGGLLVDLMPPTLRATAYSGDINIVGKLTLAPSPTGNVSLLANGSINGLQLVTQDSNFGSTVYGAAAINLSDANPAAFPGINAPMPILYPVLTATMDISFSLLDPRNEFPILSSFASLVTETAATQGPNATQSVQQQLHDRSLLHLGDPEPVRIYAKSGDITSLGLFSPKASRIYAGRDIADVALYLQNLTPQDTSQVIAGRDIIAYDESTPLRQVLAQPQQAASNGVVPTISVPTALPGDISIGGPGLLDVFAGRNLTLGNAPNAFALAIGKDNAAGFGFGLVSIGNERNPYLPTGQGATITAGAGIGAPNAAAGNNADYASFIANFIDPASAGSEATRNLPYLATLLGISDSNLAWAKFGTLSSEQQHQLALDVFYKVLRDSGRDHNDPNAVNGTRNYEVGFRAIATLFPGNSWQGDISLAAHEIKTARGGDINLLAPGGQLVVGFDLGTKQPLDQGILTLESGNINIFANNSVAVGTSRIFTFRGGDETIWSTTGNIAAGSASKTLISAPPARFLIDPTTGASVFDPAGLATGGGIGVLQTIKGAPPGNVDLIAPAGFVDAGDAGIRVSGNLNIAAVQVLNAGNIQVGGSTTGVPVVTAPNIGALTAANSAAGSASRTDTPTGSAPTDQPSIILVEFLGFGGGDGSQDQDLPDGDRRQNRQGRHSGDASPIYNPNGAVRILGVGSLTDDQKKSLSEEEKGKL